MSDKKANRYEHLQVIKSPIEPQPRHCNYEPTNQSVESYPERLHDCFVELKYTPRGETSTLETLVALLIDDIISQERHKFSKVWVVLHISKGVLYNSAVYVDKTKAQETKDEWSAGATDEDTIDMQECMVVI